MQLIYRNKRFVFLCHYIMHQTPKQAGFVWDPQRREWWTDNFFVAAKLSNYADVVAKSELEKCFQKVAESRSVAAELDIPTPEGLSYFPFQKAGIHYMLQRQYVLLADEMGLGKTPMSIGVINIERPKKVLIIVPPNILKLNWVFELRRWLLHPYTIYLVNDAPFEFHDDMIIIVNYERVIKPYVFERLRQPFDLLIVDECHKIKNPAAKRTRVILSEEPALLDFAKKALFLSGSPMPNRPIELFPLLNKLFPKRWTYWSFARRYCAAHKDSLGYWDVSGASNLEELHMWLREKLMLRRLKSEVLQQLPEKQRQLIVFDADTAKDVLDKELALLEQTGIKRIESVEDLRKWRTALRKLSSSSEEVHIMHLRHLVGLRKVPFIIEHIKEFLEGSEYKAIVFGHHREVLEKIHDAFKEYSVLIYGGTNDSERQEALEKFKKDEKCRLLCANINIVGLGLTLTEANVVMFAELDFTPSNMIQAEDRCHRIGQKQTVLIQYLVFNNSLDVQIAELLLKKQHWMTQLLDKEPTIPEQKPEILL